MAFEFRKMMQPLPASLHVTLSAHGGKSLVSGKRCGIGSKGMELADVREKPVEREMGL